MSGGPQAEKIRTLFNTIAGDYDRLNHLLSLGIDRTWRKRALSEILPASKVLDVACGTGDFSLEIAGRCVRRAIPCAITGLDLSEGMLAVMREKVARAGYAEDALLPNAEGASTRGKGAFVRKSIIISPATGTLTQS